MEAINSSALSDNRDELIRIIDSVLTQAKAMGATSAEADIGAGSGYHTFRMAAKAQSGFI